MKKLIIFGLLFSGYAMACGPSAQTLIDTEAQVAAQRVVNDDRSADQIACLAAQVAAMPSPSPSASPSQ